MILPGTSDSAFVIQTREDGVKEGRKYRFQASSKAEMEDWFDAILTVREHFEPEVQTAFGYDLVTQRHLNDAGSCEQELEGVASRRAC